MSDEVLPEKTFASNGASSARPEQLASQLRQEIVTGHWPVDGALPAEHELMLRFGVSRSTYREALRLLESQGLLKRLRGAKGGARILQPDITPVTQYTGTFLQMHGATGHDLWQMILLIEPMAVRMIAETGSLATIGELAQIVTAQRYLLQEYESFIDHELNFRRALLRLCGSATNYLFGSVALELAEVHSKNVRKYGDSSSDQPMMQEAIASKEALIRFIEDRSSDEAEHLWRNYVQSTIQRTLARAKEAGLLQLYLSPDGKIRQV